MSKPKRREKKRATYHHGDLTEALITATLAMVEEVGAASVSLREVARRAGVSSGAPFRHFKSKEALLIAVAARGAKQLDAAMRRAAAGHAEPIDRFRAMGVAYVAWAVRHPELFSLIHSPDLHREDLPYALTSLVQEQRDTIAQLLSRGPSEGVAVTQTVLLAGHALVYGLARLLIDHVFTQESVSPSQARRLARDVTGVLGRGLGAASPSSGPAPEERDGSREPIRP